MTKDIYRQLQESLDQYSVGFPATQSGIEIEILKHLFSETDAQLCLALSLEMESPEIIAERVEQPIENIEAQLNEMAQKGLIFRVKEDGISKYGAIAFIHGIFEFQVKTLQPDLVKMIGRYSKEALGLSMQKNAGHFLRVVPVNQSVDVTHKVASYDDAVQILKNQDRIILTECVCRKASKLLDSGCGKPVEACFMFDTMGQYYLDNDMGRAVSLDEAIAIFDKCQEAGLVTQPATSQNPMGMCNCCGDCCGVLGSIRKHPNPAELVFSNHLAAINAEECIGCGDCLERCQMDALSLNEEGVIDVAQNRCIGCGLCVTTCPTHALSLVDKPEKEMRLPPLTTDDQMIEMAKYRAKFKI